MSRRSMASRRRGGRWPRRPSTAAGRTSIRVTATWAGASSRRAKSSQALSGEAVPAGIYDERRVALAIAEGGLDYALGDTFPHEANYDRLNGVSFTKGCFVGQEVVARMQNRTLVRKRVTRITGTEPLVTGAEVRLGAAVLGTAGSVAGTHALALAADRSCGGGRRQRRALRRPATRRLVVDADYARAISGTSAAARASTP
jgi:folate-binding protein YgfZ